MALSPRRLCTGTGRPGAGHGGPARRPRRDGSTSAGCSGASAGRRSRRRSWRRPGRSVERRLSRAPDDEAAAAALAELLPDADESRGWTILQPDVMTSAAGATLTRLPDGSVLAGGRNPAVDTYTVEAVTTLAGITGLRLEAIPDPSLPHHGLRPGSDQRQLPSGRDPLEHQPPSQGAPVPVRLSRACADHSDPRPGFTGVSGTLDTDPSTAWSIWPQMGRPHWAVFQTARPIGTGAGTRLRVELASQTRHLAQRSRPVPPVGHEPAVPVLRTELDEAQGRRDSGTA